MDALLTHRMRDAINRHDLDAFVACFAPEYRSEQPVHPGRAFQGPATVRLHWSTFFAQMPDFRAETLRVARAGDEEWAEWRWSGTLADGTPWEARGTIVQGVAGGLVRWARIFMEPVEHESTVHRVG
jgi:ketosteroid isomerase-like protein